MNSNSVVLYEKRDSVAYLTLNRPEALNALSREVLTRLSALLEEIRKDESVRAVIITGAGSKAFSAGADIKYLSQSTPMKVREFSQLAVTVTNQIENLGKVVVAALNGYTFGGGLEIAEACMIRVAVKSSYLGHPEVSIGAVAGFRRDDAPGASGRPGAGSGNAAARAQRQRRRGAADRPRAVRGRR